MIDLFITMLVAMAKIIFCDLLYFEKHVTAMS